MGRRSTTEPYQPGPEEHILNNRSKSEYSMAWVKYLDISEGQFQTRDVQLTCEEVNIAPLIRGGPEAKTLSEEET